MKVKRVVFMKFEELAECEGVLTLVSPDGEEVRSEYVSFQGNTYNLLGVAAKSMVLSSKEIRQ